MKVSIIEARDFIANLTSHFVFLYNEKICGVDPFSANEFDVWYGKDNTITVKSVEEVFSLPFFDGKSLTDIFGDIEVTEM